MVVPPPYLNDLKNEAEVRPGTVMRRTRDLGENLVDATQETSPVYISIPRYHELINIDICSSFLKI